MSRKMRQPICNLQFAICNLQWSSPSTVYRLPSTSRRRRQAFTLVELLMVITIIGMLVAFVSVAAVRAIGTARNAQITTEISLLDTALTTYKNEIAGGMPPDCSLMTANVTSAAQAPVAQDTTNRQNRILAHFRKAYPRLSFPYGYGTGAKPETQTGTLQYVMQQAFANYDSQSTTPPVTYSGYAAMAPGAIWGDLDNLDPGEAIVFWIGGPPAPPFLDGSGKWSFTLRGFSANKLNPCDLIATARATSAFEFQQSRLGDADGDGWPEYYPPVGGVAQPPNSTVAVSNPAPPYVYFDAFTYMSVATAPTTGEFYPQSAMYPSPLSLGTNAATGKPGMQPSSSTVSLWGSAIPYVQSVSPPNSSSVVQVNWVEPKSCQIISAGLDQMYWFWPPPFPATPPQPNQFRFFPLGTNYSQGDLDNLTCFTTSTLQSAQP